MKTPEFQRLRRISQLGLASYVFPGAVHTRFSHSLGSAHLATRVIRHLTAIHDDAEMSQHAQLVERAALLHDIGHGPFSHSFERALVEIVGKGAAPSHEDWTRKIVTARFPTLPEESRRQIADIVAPEFKSSRVRGATLLTRDIVSSQLDVDRMDYLVRDSHFTGVAAGAIDLDYLRNNPTPAPTCGAKRGAGDRPRLLEARRRLQISTAPIVQVEPGPTGRGSPRWSLSMTLPVFGLMHPPTTASSGSRTPPPVGMTK